MIGVGLHGFNGHQVHRQLAQHRRARLVAVAGLAGAEPPVEAGEAERRASLAELIEDPAIDLVVLCSPRRADQAADALACLAGGKHVLAEKPAALREADVDALLAAAREHGRVFREMAATAFEQPYRAMRAAVDAGAIGRVVQVHVQKSYPWHDGRPRDEAVDGGLIAQVGIHALRLVEQVALAPIEAVEAARTGVDGTPRAASLLLRLAGGALATATVNYLGQRGAGVWGFDELRIFGTDGFVESTDGGRRTRLVVGEEDRGPLDVSAGGIDWFDRFVEHLETGAAFPLDVEAELRPLRWALRARDAAARTVEPVA